MNLSARLIAFQSILAKDIKTYYLKPPNLSWGLIFPLAWTAMFMIRSSGDSFTGFDLARLSVEIPELLPGLMAISILFGTTSMLAVTITFEKKNRSFERLLLAPISLELLMLAKTFGAIIFGVINASVPLIISIFLADLSSVAWLPLLLAVLLVSVTSTFLGLFIAVSVSEVFEAQTFSNFFRFPMIFLCGLFFPVSWLPLFIQPLSYLLPLTYGVRVFRYALEPQLQTAAGWFGGFGGFGWFGDLWLEFTALILFSLVLFRISIINFKKRSRS